MKLVVLGLSLSSSWGNGHATTYRSLLRAFAARGHEILFLERDVAWYAAHRDLPEPDFCRLAFYTGLDALSDWRAALADADAVILGSYVPQGVEVGELVLSCAHGIRGFYDIDTPVTLAALARGEEDYLAAQQIARYDLYLSFTGGPTLDLLRERYGAKRPVALYCSADPDRYRPTSVGKRWDLSYLGTYSADRQPALEKFLLTPARLMPERRFAVAGPQYPACIAWPGNVEHLEHVAPADHAAFYGASRMTLNLTRADMIAAGYSPSVRLFEAGACGTAIVSDAWPGLLDFFTADEISIAHETQDVLKLLEGGEAALDAQGQAALRRILASHTAAHRAAELEAAIALASRSSKPAIMACAG